MKGKNTGKTPTRRQKQILKSLRLNPDNWLIGKECAEGLTITHRISGQSRLIKKELIS